MFAINYWNFAKEVKKQQHYFHHVNNVPVLYHCNHSKVSSEVANIYHSATTLKSLVYSYIGPLCDTQTALNHQDMDTDSLQVSCGICQLMLGEDSLGCIMLTDFASTVLKSAIIL